MNLTTYLRMSRSKPTRHSTFKGGEEEESRWDRMPALTCEQHVKCAASLWDRQRSTGG